jgi:hypothetical protein
MERAREIRVNQLHELVAHRALDTSADKWREHVRNDVGEGAESVAM